MNEQLNMVLEDARKRRKKDKEKRNYYKDTMRWWYDHLDKRFLTVEDYEDQGWYEWYTSYVISTTGKDFLLRSTADVITIRIYEKNGAGITYQQWKKFKYLFTPLFDSIHLVSYCWNRSLRVCIMGIGIFVLDSCLHQERNRMEMTVQTWREVFALLDEFCDPKTVPMLSILSLHVTEFEVKWNFEKTLLETRETITPLELEDIKQRYEHPRIIINL